MNNMYRLKWNDMIIRSNCEALEFFLKVFVTHSMQNKAYLPFIIILATSVIASYCPAQLLILQPAQLSPPNLSDAEGVSIVINPVNPSQMAAGSDVNYFYYSTNRGQSWIGNGINSSFGDPGDPSLAGDSKGNIYYAHLSGTNLDRIVIQKSIDGGIHYTDGTFTGLEHNPKQEYKAWIVCDQSTASPNKDALYLSWTEFDSYQSKFPQFDSSRILFSRSNDEGLTWSAPIVVNDKQGDCADSSNTVEGARCATAPNGDIYITWCGPDGLLFDKSTDGGNTFGKDKILSSLTPGWDFSVSGIYKCSAFATPLCDNSASKYRGNLYVVFSDKRNGPNNSDIFLLRSTDGGESWNAPLRVNNDTTTTEQFFPSATIDQSTGIIYCLFYDRRDHIGRNLTEVYLARSIDGGESFQNYRLNSNPFNPSSKIYLGDYTHIAAQNTYIFPAWTEEKSNNDGVTFTESIWSTIIIDTSALRDGVPPEHDNPISLQITPNPVSSQVHLNFIHPQNMVSSIEITDVIGRIIIKNFDNNQTTFDANHLQNGVYNCIAQCGGQRVIGKFIIER
jgi:hypothetical protein